MIRLLPIRRPALACFFSALFLCDCLPRDPSSPEPAISALPAEPEPQILPWKKVSGRPGWAFFKLRQEGVVNLLIFGGLKDGVKEAAGAGAVLTAGWDVLTLSPEPLEGEEPARREEFFRFALEQPGYRRKVLVASGEDLLSILRIEQSALAGLVIIRPGDAGYPDPAARNLLAQVPETLPVLLLFAPNENPAGYYTASLLRAQDKQLRLEPDIQAQRLLDGRILNFLHVIRYPVEFMESRKTFRKGCRILPDGAWVIAYVSGERADGFCPLLLRFGGDTYRAVGVLPEAACDYGITPGPVIRCR